ncbi:MAG: hypothetical protein RBT70_05935 [Alphaproteobacteria bacterium]|nr:hypothetical protein [Alphaproteobacteria bacterium]
MFRVAYTGMKRKFGLKARALRAFGATFFLAAFLFLSGALLQPSPSYAYVQNGAIVADIGLMQRYITQIIATLENFAIQSGLYTSIIAGWQSFSTAMEIQMTGLREVNIDIAKIEIAEIQTLAKTEEILANAEIDALTSNRRMKTRLDQALHGQLSVPSEQFLCNSIVARGSLPILREYASSISTPLLQGYNNRGRGKGVDGSGVQYSKDRDDARCGRYGSENNNPATGSILDAAPDCQADDIGAGLGYGDKAIDAASLGFDRAYTTPARRQVTDRSGNTVWEYYADPEDNDSQRQWLAVREYCFNAGGPRPTPPWGEDIPTPKGYESRSTFETCASRESKFAKQCLYRLAKISRPNCDDPNMTEVCNAAVKSCDAARATKLYLPPEFNNCSEGLSLYQAEYIANNLCGTPRYVQALVNGGATHAEVQRYLLECTKAKDSWQKQIDQEEYAFNRAMYGYILHSECYAGANRANQ